MEHIRGNEYRSTFYRYFDTKDEMLRKIEREYLETTRSLTPTIHHYHPDATSDEMTQYLEELTADMEYHLKDEKLCRFLLSAAGDIWFYEKMKESLISTSRKNLENGRLPHWNNMDYRISFFAAGFIDTIYTWLQKKDRTPEQMARFLLEMLVQLRS